MKILKQTVKFWLFISLISFASGGYAYDPFADQIQTDTANFNSVLSSADTDVQKALETLDDITVSLDNIYLKLDGSNANSNIDISSYNFTTTGIGTFGNLNIDTTNIDGNVISNSTGVLSLSTTDLVTGSGGWIQVQGDGTPDFPLEIYGTGSSGSPYQASVASFTSKDTQSGNSYGIEIDKNGYEAVYWGISRDGGIGEIPSRSTYMNTFSSTGKLSFGRAGNGSSPTSDLFIDGSGQVGVNTTSPGALFDVNNLFTVDSLGNVNVGSDSNVGGNTQTIWADNSYYATLNFMESPVYGLGLTYSATGNNLYIVRYANSSTSTNIVQFARDTGLTTFLDDVYFNDPVAFNSTIFTDIKGSNRTPYKKIGSYVLDIHPESGNPIIIPFYMNDIAFNNDRGGSVTLTPSLGTSDNLFDGKATTCYWSSPTGTITVEINFHKTFKWGTHFGFSMTDYFRAKDFTVYSWDIATSDWVVVDTRTNYSGGVWFYNLTSAMGASSSGTSKMKIEFSNFNSAESFRLAEVFVLNYSGDIGTGYFLTHGGGTLYGDLDMSGYDLTASGVYVDQLFFNNTDDNVIIGSGSMSSYANSIKIGNGATIIGDSAIAIGNNATAEERGIAMACEDEAYASSEAFALGDNTVGDGISAVAIGGGATAIGYKSVAIGGDSTADSGDSGGDPAIAIGADATADGEFSMALGASSSASDGEWVVGSNDYTDGYLNALSQIVVRINSNIRLRVNDTQTISAGSLIVGNNEDTIDYYLSFNGYNNDGVLYWKEDEDYFQFDDTVYFPDNVILQNGNPTISVSGNIGVDTTNDELVYYGTQANVLYPKFTRTVTVYDDGDWDSEEIPVFDFPDVACTIKAVRVSVLGSSTPTLTFNLEERAWGTDVTTSGTAITSSAMTADADGLEQTSFSNAGMASKAHLFLTTSTSSESGTVDALIITVEYTIDRT